MPTQTSITLTELFEGLDRYPQRVSLEWLAERLKHLEIDWKVIEPFVRFAPDSYRGTCCAQDLLIMR
jgi:hypothetical protein